MNRIVAASLAAAVTAAGLAWGQSATPTAAPKSTVVRKGPTDRPAFGTQATPLPEVDQRKVGDTLPDSEPEPEPEQKPRRQPPPAGQLPPTVIRKPIFRRSEPKKSEAPKSEPKKAPDAAKAEPKKDTPKKADVKPNSGVRPAAHQQPGAPNPNSPITLPSAIPVPPGADIKPPAKPAEPPVPPADKPVTPAAPAVAPAKPAPNNEVVPPPLMAEPPQHYPTYASNLIEPMFPWTKCGRRVCGTVYVDTPYGWMNTEYSWGWVKHDRTVPLVTSGPAGVERPGVLGEPGTEVIFSGQTLHDEPYYGGRFTGGVWFDECQYCGVEGGYFFFGSQDRGIATGANGYPATPGLYRPFFNPLTGVEDAFVTAQAQGPNGVGASGFIEVNSKTRAQSADGHALFSFSRGLNFRIDAMLGARWMNLDEDIVVQENIRNYPLPLPNNNVDPFRPFNPLFFATDVGVRDAFSTRNDFIGADFGFKAHFRRNAWSLDVLTRCAVGGTHQIIRNEGFTGVTFLGLPTVVTNTGRLVGPANAGVFGNDSFSIVPEVGFTIGYMPKHWLRLTAGYNWMYWTNVVRPGAQIDRVVNPIGVPTRPEFQSDLYEPRRPGIIFGETDIWLQSVTVGMQFLY